jgi:AraC family transcriptional regulator
MTKLVNPKIQNFPTTQFIGKSLDFCYANYQAFALWSSFMPHRKEILNTIGTDLYNIQVNPKGFDFSPNSLFTKWAAVPVSSLVFVPEGMEVLEIQEGLYAVFPYVGDTSTVASFFRTIYTQWLPNSDYELDDRPQFEILGEKYKNGDPNSEEEIWIPIRLKS